MSGDEEALTARKTWRTLEPLHGMIYFVPEAAAAYAALGVVGRDGYFASRAAPMGAVSAEVVVATFYNFNPALVHAAIPAVWGVTTPAALTAARLSAVDGACRRLLGDDVVQSAEMQRAAELARALAEEAGRHTEGRPLCAAHAELPWPDEAHLALWHAQSVLREFRGDGHIALLVTHGLSGLDALVTHAAAGDVPARILRSSRAWSKVEWDAAVESLRQRGWIAAVGDTDTDTDTLKFTEWGEAQRHELEEQTDRLASSPYAALGEEACAELRSLARPWSRTFSEVLFR